MIRRIIFPIIFLACAVGRTLAGEPDELERNWKRYEELFRSPREILFEVRQPADRTAMDNAAELLRTYPQVEEAFAIHRPCGADIEQAKIFLLLNSPPQEFGAFLEKLQPHLVRREFANLRKFKEQNPIPPGQCPHYYEPLCVKDFIGIPGALPFFKQTVPSGVYARLRSGLGADACRQQGVQLEQDLRNLFDQAGFEQTEIIRRQDLPPPTPQTARLMVAFWLAAALIGTCLFALCYRGFAPYLALLGTLLAVYLLLTKLGEWLPSFFDPRLLPAGLCLLLLWGVHSFARSRAIGLESARVYIRGKMLAFLMAGIVALPVFIALDSGALAQTALCLLILPAGLTGLLLLFACGWAQERAPQFEVSPVVRAFERIFWARKNGLILFCMAALTGFLIWQAWRERPAAFSYLTPLIAPIVSEACPTNPVTLERREPLERWELAPAHALSYRTLCLLSEGKDWGQILFQTSAERFGCSAAKQDKLLSRYWNPGAWVPRPAWQKANAVDFLKKRNIVVLEKIAKQEGLTQEDIAETIGFLNRVGEACVPLASGETTEWVPSRNRNEFGLSMRQWIREEPGPTYVALSYAWLGPTTTEQVLIPWIAEAMRPFGVQPQWIAPGLLQRRAVKKSLMEMSAVALLFLIFLALEQRLNGSLWQLRVVAATFLFLASWFLTLVGLGWTWSAGGIWVWTSAIGWHCALLMGWLRRGISPQTPSILASTLIAAGTLIGAIVLWPQFGETGTAARVLGTGVFWSLAWTMLLAPGDRELKKTAAQANVIRL